MIGARLKEVLQRQLGRRCLGARSLSGGDINAAFAVEFEGLGPVLVKTRDPAPANLFSTEAEGLRWLGEALALRVPRVLGFSEADQTPAFLILEYLESARPRQSFDETLGRGLAKLHRAGASSFGFAQDNFIGTLPQQNTPTPSWAEFYRARRLEPQLKRAVESGKLSYAVRRDFDRLFAQLESLVGPHEPPSRLHGDLWGGNLHVDENGDPCLIDPAVYGGHREVDLAMMRLFGGFSERVFSAYQEDLPLAPAATERVALYQLYPLLVHTNLFGGSYAASVKRALSRIV